MYAFVVAWSIPFAFGSGSMFIPEDATEIDSRRFHVPVRVDAAQAGTISRLNLFRSNDAGKTWKCIADIAPTRSGFPVSVPKDGLYWFALQTVFTDGSVDLLTTEELFPTLIVWVNSRKAKAPKAITVGKHSEQDLNGRIRSLTEKVDQQQKELQLLRDDLQRLQNRLDAMEAEKKESSIKE